MQSLSLKKPGKHKLCRLFSSSLTFNEHFVNKRAVRLLQVCRSMLPNQGRIPPQAGIS